MHIIIKYLKEMIDDTRGHLIQFLGLTQRKRKHLNFNENFYVIDNEKNDSIDISLVVEELIGYQGPQGSQGERGPQGEQGTEGVMGVDGVQGAQGAQGFRGALGLMGSRGVRGPQGARGSQGLQGFQGFEGVQGAQGFQGDAWPDIEHDSLNDIYGGFMFEDKYHLNNSVYNKLENNKGESLIGNSFNTTGEITHIKLYNNLSFDPVQKCLNADRNIYIQKNSLDVTPHREKLNFKGENISISDNEISEATDISVKTFIEAGETGESGIFYKDGEHLKIWIENDENGEDYWSIITHDQNTDYKLENYVQEAVISSYLSNKTIDFINGPTSSIESYKVEDGKNLIITNILSGDTSGNTPDPEQPQVGIFTIIDTPAYEIELRPPGINRLEIFPSDELRTPLGLVTHIWGEDDFATVEKIEQKVKCGCGENEPVDGNQECYENRYMNYVTHVHNTDLYRYDRVIPDIEDNDYKIPEVYKKYKEILEQNSFFVRFCFFKELNNRRFFMQYARPEIDYKIYLRDIDWPIGSFPVIDTVSRACSDMIFYKDSYYITFTDKRIRRYDLNFNVIGTYLLDNVPTYMFKYQDLWIIIDAVLLGSPGYFNYIMIVYEADSDGHFNPLNKIDDIRLKGFLTDYNYAIIAAPNILLDYKNGFFYISCVLNDEDTVTYYRFYLSDILNPGIDSYGKYINYDEFYQSSSTLTTCAPWIFDGHIFIPEIKEIEGADTLTNIFVCDVEGHLVSTIKMNISNIKVLVGYENRIIFSTTEDLYLKEITFI